MDLFDNFCRTCGNEFFEAMNIFDESSKSSNNVSIQNMLIACLPPSLPPISEDDNYPKHICNLCSKKLVLAFEFFQSWTNAHTEFNVALKFEQVRKRSRSTQEGATTAIQNRPRITTESAGPIEISPTISSDEVVEQDSVEYLLMSQDEMKDEICETVDDIEIIAEDEDVEKNTVVYKIEPNEELAPVTDSAIYLASVHSTSIKSKKPALKEDQNDLFGCRFCTTQFHTIKALRIHHKFAHPNNEWIEPN